MKVYQYRSRQFTAGGLVLLLHIAGLYVLIEHKLNRNPATGRAVEIDINFPIAQDPVTPRVRQTPHANISEVRENRKTTADHANRTLNAAPAETLRENADAATNRSAEEPRKLDLNAMLDSAKDMDHRRTITGLDRLHDSEAPRGTLEEKFGADVAKAGRPDCRTKYVTPETNLILLIPLAIETVTGKGCKW